MQPGGLTALEARFFGFVQSGALDIVATGQLISALGIGPLQEKRLLSRLARRSLIARVRRGLYLVPSRIPVGGNWSPSEAVALSTLMADRSGRYQISGPNAFSRYGWDQQIPNQTFVYNNRLSGERKIGANQFVLTKVGDNRLGATELVKGSDGANLIYASRARALVDAVYDWSRFNTLPRAYGWIRIELERDDRFVAEFVNAAIKYGNQGTVRRIGKLLESAAAPRSLLRKMERALRPTSSFIPWDPTRPKRGTIDNRWMVMVNDAQI